MRDFVGKTAVVTGAASGIGYALAERCLEEGMRVVLADVDECGLKTVEETLWTPEAEMLCVPTDVADLAAVQRLAAAAIERFRSVHLLFNNAGITTVSDLGPLWLIPYEELKRMVDINLWGVVYGCATFIPMMLDQSSECHIVNTASIAGLTSGRNAVYRMTKHGVVALSEALCSQLESEGGQVGVSVLCPHFVRTAIMRRAAEQSRNVKESLKEEIAKKNERVVAGTDPKEIALSVFRAVRERTFYIVPHGFTRAEVEERFSRILACYGDGL